MKIPKSENRTIIDPTEVKGGVLLLASANYICAAGDESIDLRISCIFRLLPRTDI